MRLWSKCEHDLLCSLYPEMALSEISKKLGRSEMALRVRLAAFGVSKGHPQRSPVFAASKALGISREEWITKRGAGLKWCWRCTSWKKRIEFPPDANRKDDLSNVCKICKNAYGRSKPSIPRNPQHQKIRTAITHAIRRGDLVPAKNLPCMDCGDMGTGRRHEYDHYLGYADEHKYDVQIVCSRCHRKRHVERSKQKDFSG